MSFYLTYRPQTIDEIDNIRVRDTIASLLSKPKTDLPHAYFFSGPRGGGKTTAARLIAKLFNCEKPLASAGPCGKCSQCVSIAEGRNLDVMELDAASNRGIDEIRSLREGIGLAPAAATYKIYIIDEVHMLTTEAFNALLKTLEEPPKHAVFVLATTDPQKVPVTITSRCMPLVFTKASTKELLAAVGRIVKKEKITIDDEALTLIAASVDGSFRDAVKVLEQASFQKGKITQKVVQSMLSLTSQADVESFSDALLAREARECLKIIQSAEDNGIDLKSFTTQTLYRLHGLLVDIVTGDDTKNVALQQDLELAIRKLSTAYTELKNAAIVQLPLELAVMEYCEEQNVTRDTPQATRKEEAPRVNISHVTSHVSPSSGSLTLEKLTEHWLDVIAELKPYNHSVAGVMRSTRPVSVKDGIVTIEAFYTFHKEKLSETKTREMIGTVIKKLFGEKVRVEIVLGKK